ncbi:mandelate racemase/muconate lactonizing enzyme family protein [Streptomyces sp. NPDC006385]|uniref:mandelate racemase/muconate lactonizing enzyme family protein n=1 Tax=Streptomyces sp. NPDC006385 TaxID=3156761 RepID=UPI0033A0B33D
MRIDSIEVYGYDLSYRHGAYVMSGGRSSEKQSSTVVRLVTDEGIEGWGECAPLAGSYLPSHTEGIRASLSCLAPLLVGLDPRNTGLVNLVMNRHLRGQYGAKSAIDIACWDVLGRSSGLPVTDLLGGRVAEDFPLYVAVPLGSDQDMVAFVKERMLEGTGTFQLKVGNQPHDDIRRIQAVLSAVGEEGTVIADANGGWDVLDARTVIAAVQSSDVIIEQPCVETRSCALVQQGSRRPLVLDESIVTVGDVAEGHLTAGAHAVNIKLGRVGGLTAARIMRDTAIGLGMKVTLEDTWGGDLTSAAVSHLAAGTNPASLLSASFFNDWTNEHIADYEPRSRNGRGSAPTAPGLGIQVDPGTLGAPLFVVRNNQP